MSNLDKRDPIRHLQVRVNNVIKVYEEEEITWPEAAKRIEHILDDYQIDIAEEKELFAGIERHPSSGNAGGEKNNVLSFPVGETSIDGVILP